MTREQEILTDYRLIVMEIETLERQSKFLNKYIGGPRPVRSPQLTGMPRGTNEPEAAMLQQLEEDDPIYHIEQLSADLREMMMEFETIVNKITDFARNILKNRCAHFKISYLCLLYDRSFVISIRTHNPKVKSLMLYQLSYAVS